MRAVVSGKCRNEAKWLLRLCLRRDSEQLTPLVLWSPLDKTEFSFLGCVSPTCLTSWLSGLAFHTGCICMLAGHTTRWTQVTETLRMLRLETLPLTSLYGVIACHYAWSPAPMTMNPKRGDKLLHIINTTRQLPGGIWGNKHPDLMLFLWCLWSPSRTLSTLTFLCVSGAQNKQTYKQIHFNRS